MNRLRRSAFDVRRFIVLLLFACLAPVEYVTAQGAPDPWYSRQPRPQNMDSPKVFTGYFSVELPRDWQLAPGYTGTVFSLVQKTKRWEIGALITLEYMRLRAPLDPSLIDAVRESELTEVQARELAGKRFSGVVKTGPLGPIILIQYDRVGLSGTEDRVVQYSIPAGTTMYRLVCVAPVAAIEKYRTIFAHVAASFTPLKPSGS